MGKLNRRPTRPLHELREMVDLERIFENPNDKRDLVLKRRSSFLGRLLNFSIMRPHKGKTYGRDFGPKAKPYTREDIIKARKEK